MNVLLKMNDLLATKGNVKYSETRAKYETICKYHRGIGEDVCREYKFTEVHEYSAPAAAAADQVIVVKEIKYFEDQLASFPDRAVISRKDIRNSSPATITSSITMSVSATSGWSVQKTNTVVTTSSVTANVGFQFVITAGVALNFSKVITLSESKTESGSETMVRSTTDTISIGARQSIRIDFLVYEVTREVPYEAKVVFDGPLIANASGFTLASQLLSEDERTFVVQGKIRVTGVSEAQLSVEELKTEGNELHASENAVMTSQSQITLYGTDTVKKYLTARFTGQKNVPRDAKSKLLQVKNDSTKQLENGTTIGEPDGIKYSILYTVQEFRMTPMCPFNDIGLPGTGIFEVETRQYTEHASGVLIRTWQENVERFIACRDF